MSKRKQEAHGGHGWFVTFADLMGLLVSFFVMLVAFSNQDAKKVQAVAGSMRDAFGVQTSVRYSGLVEVDGLPTRPRVKNAERIDPLNSSISPTPPDKFSGVRKDEAFALAAASLRQALKDMPELTETSKHVMIEESKEGLNINIVDQDGRSMFAEGSKEPYEQTRHLIQKIAGPLKSVPYRISITGHTSSGSDQMPRHDDGKWNLSVSRADVVRQILEKEGYPSANIYKVSGKADTDPLFSEDPSIAANRRITITLIREAPPVPPELQP